MRTLACPLVSLVQMTGCCASANSTKNPSLNTEPKNTWTADALVRGDIDAIKERVGSSPAYLTQRDDYHDTPLMTALAHDHLELVEFLLSQKADPNVSVDDGYTCLLTAIDCESDSQE